MSEDKSGESGAEVQNEALLARITALETEVEQCNLDLMRSQEEAAMLRETLTEATTSPEVVWCDVVDEMDCERLYNIYLLNIYLSYHGFWRNAGRYLSIFLKCLPVLFQITWLNCISQWLEVSWQDIVDKMNCEIEEMICIYWIL